MRWFCECRRQIRRRRWRWGACIVIVSQRLWIVKREKKKCNLRHHRMLQTARDERVIWSHTVGRLVQTIHAWNFNNLLNFDYIYYCGCHFPSCLLCRSRAMRNKKLAVRLLVHVHYWSTYLSRRQSEYFIYENFRFLPLRSLCPMFRLLIVRIMIQYVFARQM